MRRTLLRCECGRGRFKRHDKCWKCRQGTVSYYKHKLELCQCGKARFDAGKHGTCRTCRTSVGGIRRSLCVGCGLGLPKYKGKWCSNECLAARKRCQCIDCGKPVGQQKRCGDCYRSYLSERKIRTAIKNRGIPQQFTCKNCGGLINKAPSSKADNRKRDYCSPRCKVSAFGKKQNAIRTKNCTICGLQFVGYTRSICSSECRSEAVKRSRHRADDISARCVVCSSPFLKRPSSHVVTCGRKCGHVLVTRKSLVTVALRPSRDCECALCGRVFTVRTRRAYCHACSCARYKHYPYLPGSRNMGTLTAEEKEILETTKALRTLRQEADAWTKQA